MLAVLASTVAASGAAAQDVERFSLSGDVAIFNLAGNLVIEPDTGAATVLELTRGGADASQLDIDIGEIDGWQTLRVRYPENGIVYPRIGGGSRIDIHVEEDGRFGTTWDGRTPGTSSTGGLLSLFGFGRGRRVSIRGGGTGLEAYADLRVLVPAGATVAIHIGAGSARTTNVRGRLFIETQTGGIESVGHHGELRLDSGTGDIRAVDGRGDLHIETGTGDVAAQAYAGEILDVVTGTGAMRGSDLAFIRAGIDSGSGDIEIDSIIARDRIEIDTGFGSITLNRVASKDILLDAGAGRVNVELLAHSVAVDIDTGARSVTLSVPSDLGADLDLVGSRIEVDLPIRLARRDRDSARATVDQDDGSIRIEAGSGAVRIRNASIR